MGSNHFEKMYQNVPIKIGMSIAIAIGFVFLILLGGAAWAAPPRVKRMRKTKPMVMATLMPILNGTFWYCFSKWFDPI